MSRPVSLVLLVVALAIACTIGYVTERALDRAALRFSGGPAVCSTDADCAAWEVLHNVPLAARCFGAPCPAKGGR